MKKFPLSIDGEEFFKIFKINNNNMKIVKTCKKQVDLFKSIKAQFDKERKRFPEGQQADLAFEFQAFMAKQILRWLEGILLYRKFVFTSIQCSEKSCSGKQLFIYW